MTETAHRTADCRPEAAADASAAHGPLSWGRSARLALREFVAADRAALVDMHREPRVREHLVDDYPLHEEAVAAEFLARLPLVYRRFEGLGIWHASLLQPHPVFAGWFNLMPMAERPGEVEIGSRLLPLAWGSGLVLEGCELLLDHAFDDLHLPRVWGICHRDNRRARAVLTLQGFEDLGDGPYDGGTARHYCIDAHAWSQWRAQSRATRLRRLVRAADVDASLARGRCARASLGPALAA